MSKTCISIVIIGAVFIAASVLLFIRNSIESFQAGKASSNAFAELIAAIEENRDDPETTLSDDPRSNNHHGFGDIEVNTEMKTIVVDGIEYIGYITIPKLNIELPVISEVNSDYLKIAPCRMLGSIADNDLIIAGHNYSRHFGSIYQLKEGDPVFFTDVEGKVTEYAVSDQEILEPTHIWELKQGDWDLTLFTCTYGGKQRVVVRCKNA